MKTLATTSLGREKGSVSDCTFYPSSKNARAGAHGRMWVPRPQRNTFYSLSVQGLLCLLFYTTQDHLRRSATAHGRLGLPASIMNQETCPVDMSTGQSEAPSSQLTPAWVKFTKVTSVADPFASRSHKHFHTEPQPFLVYPNTACYCHIQNIV